MWLGSAAVVAALMVPPMNSTRRDQVSGFDGFWPIFLPSSKRVDKDRLVLIVGAIVIVSGSAMVNLRSHK